MRDYDACGPTCSDSMHACKDASPKISHEEYVRMRQEQEKQKCQQEYVRQMISQNEDKSNPVPDTRADVAGLLTYLRGFQDALDIFSTMLEDTIGE